MQHARNFLVIERLGQNRQMRWDDWDVEFSRALFYEQLVSAWFRWRKKNSFRRIRRVFQTFIAAVDADERLNFVVIWREIFVVVGPVNSEAVTAARFEIIRPHA